MIQSASTVAVRRAMALLTGTILTAWIAACGVPDQEQEATDRATRRVRGQAAQSRHAVQATLANPKAPRKQELLEVLTQLVEGEERNGRVFASQLGPDDHVQLDVAFDETGNAGGIAPAEVRVRLCVRITGVRGPQPQAEMVNTTCDPDLDRKLGQPDVIVGLKD